MDRELDAAIKSITCPPLHVHQTSSASPITWWMEQWTTEVSRSLKPDDGHVNVAADIASFLSVGKLYEHLDGFVGDVRNAFPRHFSSFLQNEPFLLALIELNLWQCNFSAVYELIQNGKFTNKQKMISIWDDTHFREKELKSGKRLTSTIKYRIRKRFPLPLSIILDGVRTKWKFPKSTQQQLNHWLSEHEDNPFPTRVQFEDLAGGTGLTVKQIKNWFSNARRRRQSLDKRKYSEGGRCVKKSLGRCASGGNSECLKLKPHHVVKVDAVVASNMPPPLVRPKDIVQFAEGNDVILAEDTLPELIERQQQPTTLNQVVVVYVPVLQKSDSCLQSTAKVSAVFLPPTMIDVESEKKLKDVIVSTLKESGLACDNHDIEKKTKVDDSAVKCLDDQSIQTRLVDVSLDDRRPAKNDVRKFAAEVFMKLSDLIQPA